MDTPTTNQNDANANAKTEPRRNPRRGAKVNLPDMVLTHHKSEHDIFSDMQKKANDVIQQEKLLKRARQMEAKQMHEANAALNRKEPLQAHKMESKLRQPGKFGRDMHRHF